MPYNSLVSRTDVSAIIPEEVSSAMLTSLSTQSAAMSLGTRIPVARNQTRFPVLSALPAAYFVNGDTGLKQTSKASWENKQLFVEELATIVPIPEAVLDDAGFDAWGSIQPLMESAIVRALDAAILFGVNAPATWAAEGNLAARSIAAGNTVTRGTATAAQGGLHADLGDVVGTLEADGIMPNGLVANVQTKSRLRKVRATDGSVLSIPDDIPTPTYPLPGLWPTGPQSVEAIAGDWTKLVVGVRQDMTYKLITEGVITDNTGAIVYNLPQQDMVALRLVFRAGYAVSNPINYEQPTAASRYPFAVLRGA